MSTTRYAALLAAALSLALTGCGTQSAGPTPDGKLAVTAAFYPLQYVTEKVGGSRVSVTNLSKPGVEPHDVELTPKDVAALKDAALVVHLRGFQPAIADAVKDLPAQANLDVADVARLQLQNPEASGEDPHFWLDPTRLAAVGQAVAARLGELDPSHADEYTANASTLTADLTALDEDMSAGLRTCTSRDLVTGHAAFGYLARRYDLTQLPISGLSPDQEPNAAQMAQIVTEVKTRGVTTVYAETLVSPKLTDTIAAQTGAKVAVLDPIEGQAEGATDKDYVDLMRANLVTLRTGQGCT